MKRIIIIILLLFVGIVVLCNLNSFFSSSGEKNLSQPLKIIDLNIPEPSGLYYDENDNTLWTVSDEVSKIYNIDLDGNILTSLLVNGKDLEGITKINDSTLVTILERDRVIVLINTKGIEQKRLKLNLKGDANKGLEGITFGKKENKLFVLNEKDPGLLLEVDTSGNVLNTTELKLAKDYSGISYDSSSDVLWITSDEDETILKCNVDGEIIETYITNIEQIEGIALDKNNKRLFLVSDPKEQLYIFELP